MNGHQKIIAAIVNVLLIAEICISMYFAGKDPENLNVIFFKYFIGMAIPTLILSRIMKRKYRSVEQAEPA